MKKVISILLTLVFVVLMKIGLAELSNRSRSYKSIIEKDFDTSLMFYTESSQVLKSEKIISKGLK